MTGQKIIINIGRQLGSGGRTIGKLLADDFGCTFYDKELLNLAAKESGFSEQFFEQHDEHWRFFKSLFHMHAHEKGRAYLTSTNAYSSSGSGNTIPGFCPLIFEIEFVDK